MASTCARLCLRCRGLLCSKASLWQQHRQFRHYFTVTKESAKISNGLFITGSHTAVQTILGWEQKMCRYNNFTAKYLTTKAKEDKYTQDSSRTDIVAYNSTLMPTSDSLPMDQNQISLDLDAADEFSALEEINDEEAVSISVPSSMPPASTSLGDYVDKSETLSKLVQLGVNLFKLEQRPNVGSMLLRLDFNTDVAPRLIFLKEIGVEDSRLSYIITHNPFILTESLENLEAR